MVDHASLVKTINTDVVASKNPSKLAFGDTPFTGSRLPN
jgi:hypothetical protein